MGHCFAEAVLPHGVAGLDGWSGDAFRALGDAIAKAGLKPTRSLTLALMGQLNYLTDTYTGQLDAPEAAILQNLVDQITDQSGTNKKHDEEADYDKA